MIGFRYSTPASKLHFQELLDTSNMREENTEDHALIFQVADMISQHIKRHFKGHPAITFIIYDMEMKSLDIT